MEALTKAREKRGWSYPEAAVRLGMTSQSLRNLERIGHTRPTIPGNATVFTMVRILETFDELDIGDFVAGTELSVRLHTL